MKPTRKHAAFSVALALWTALVLGATTVAVSADPGDKKDHKVDVCHKNEGKKGFVDINVDVNAVGTVKATLRTRLGLKKNQDLSKTDKFLLFHSQRLRHSR